MIRKEIREKTKKSKNLFSSQKKSYRYFNKEVYVWKDKRLCGDSVFPFHWGHYFLGATYVTENTKIHNELTFKAEQWSLAQIFRSFENSDYFA